MYRSSNSNNNWQSDLRRQFVMAGIPATLTIIGLSVAVWFALVMSRGMLVYDLLGFQSSRWPIPAPWTIVSWPIVDGSHPIFLLCALAWTYQIGGSLERSWGTRTFVQFFLATNALTALSMFIGGLLLHRPVMLSGMWTGIAATTIAWCLLNRREKVCLWGFISIPTMWLAWLEVAIVWYERHDPILGIFALAGCAATYFYVTKGRYEGGGFGSLFDSFRSDTPKGPSRSGRPRESDGTGFRLNRYLRDRREKRRLEELFRRSGFDDKDRR